MYSKNDYRYYLENRLAHSDDFLAHYGVQGMHWGVRKDAYTRLSERRASNDAKIAKYKERLNTTGSKNRSAKAAKYKAKQDKYDKKAAKARAKLAKGKVISRGEVRKIAKAENYRHKVAKNSIKNDKYQSKINMYEAKNAKIDKKINKIQSIDPKVKEAKKLYKEVNKDLDDALRTSARERLSGKRSQQSYEKDVVDYSAARKINKQLYKVDKAKIKHPDVFEETYKNAVEGLKAQGAVADDYIVTDTYRNGYVKNVVPVWHDGSPLSSVNESVKKVNKKRKTY